MNQAFICDAIRTPFGRYGGALSSVRADDLGAVPLRALMARNPNVDWAAVTDVIYGCANQAGEDNRNVARMSSLLAGLPLEVPGATVNRLCGSGLDAIGTAARAIKAGESGLMIAGGVESMSRAPFVMPKAESAFSRANAVYDTTIGWRFINKLMKDKYGVDSMPETAENVAVDFNIEREAQDLMALNSQLRAVAAIEAGHLAREICAVTIPQKKGDAIVVDTDEHPRKTSLEALAKLKGVVRTDGTVTAGNAVTSRHKSARGSRHIPARAAVAEKRPEGVAFSRSFCRRFRGPIGDLLRCRSDLWIAVGRAVEFEAV